MRSALLALTAVLASLLLAGCGVESRNKPSDLKGATDRAACKTDVRRAEATREFAEAKAKPADGIESRSEHDAVRDDFRDFEPEKARPHRDRPDRTPRRRIRSGTLTAGSVDDHENFDEFQSFLSKAMQGDSGEILPRMGIGRRVMIRVAGADGRPIGDARVVVRTSDPQHRGQAERDSAGRTVLDTTTGSDGLAMLLTGSARDQVETYQVSVYPPESTQPVTRAMRADQRPWRIALPETKAALPRRLDLALIVDTTGSMGDELEYLKVEIDSIAAAVHRMFPNVDQRYALIVYRDEGDQYVTRSFDFTGSLEEFRQTLSDQQAAGGGDYPEAMHLALAQAGKLSWRDRRTARVAFLVGDAPPHDRSVARAMEAVGQLRSRGVRVFPVAASGAKLKAEFVMRCAAFLTLGQYLFLTDHSGVGNPHARPHVASYQVERLDKLMIRMIASELAGKRLASDEVLAIEGGRSPRELPIEPEQQQTGRPSAGASRASASFALPSWVLLAGAILLLCLVDAAVDRTDRKGE